MASQNPEAEADWRRAHAGSGLTSKLILTYVEREGGRGDAARVLASAGLQDREEQLRNENSWFSFEDKIALWSAAEQVTGDPRVAERVGASVLDFSVGLRLKQTLRALGSPDLLFRNVARANSKFNSAHSLELAGREPGRVRLEYRDISGVGYHRYDCEYTIGLLRTVPMLFGLPAARVAHPCCGARGDDHCAFDVAWTSGLESVRRAGVLGGLAGGALAAVGLFVDPTLLVAGVGLGGLSAAVAGGRAALFMRRRIHALETEVQEHGIEAEAQLESLALLSSELRVDPALRQITTRAVTAVGGAQFALLEAEVDGMRARTHSGIPERSLHVLGRWAYANQRTLRAGPVVLDDLAAEPSLRALTADEQLPLGSACVAPLRFGDRLLGVLIAFAPGAHSFLPNDTRALEIYASHAAIALWNARLVQQLGREASEDSLTGLANRRAFDLACAAELDRAARHSHPVALAMFDIDHFKQINDTYGHPFGDQTLAAVADVLRGVVRAHDTVARVGGEEFGLLLPGADITQAHEIAERARQLLGTIELPHGMLSCSAGAAVARDPVDTVAELVSRADQALYEAKRQGRGRTVPAPLG